MDVKRKKKGFTIVELLTVLAIIALLTGLLVPALTMVRNIAKETKQKAQFTTIAQALMAFRSDYGDYPPSNWDFMDPIDIKYCGAQKLSEALLGWDLLGFHPDSDWRADGLDQWGGDLTYDPDGNRDINGDGILDTLYERVGPYLELATANAFRLDDLFGVGNTGPLEGGTFVICDSFGAKKITIGEKIVKAGTPILYYKADTRGRTTRDIYNYDNNRPLTSETVTGKVHPLADNTASYDFFYNYYIRDPKVEAVDWPYRADSYILISAGVDGLYGTSDDITNF